MICCIGTRYRYGTCWVTRHFFSDDAFRPTIKTNSTRYDDIYLYRWCIILYIYYIYIYEWYSYVRPTTRRLVAVVATTYGTIVYEISGGPHMFFEIMSRQRSLPPTTAEKQQQIQHNYHNIVAALQHEETF